jgi:DNA-binding NtrC family response regulator
MEQALDQNKKTVLLVDDDPDLVKIISGFLADRYRVLIANSSAEALRQSRDFQEEIHLLLSDVQMLDMTGVELATKITAQRPAIKVLLMSGFTGGMLILNEGWHFLPKPFVPSQLRALIVGLLSPDGISKFKTQGTA